MPNMLENNVAIITGAGRGIGAAIAHCLAQEAAKVVVNYANSAKDAEGSSRYQRSGGVAIAVQADVRRKADCVSLFDATEQAFGAP